MRRVVISQVLPPCGRNGNLLHNIRELDTRAAGFFQRVPGCCVLLCELNVLNLNSNYLWFKKRYLRWPKCHTALSLVERNIKTTLKQVSSKRCMKLRL